MRGILINSKDRSIAEVEISEKDSLNEWYRLLGVSIVETVAALAKGDFLLVDEEGLGNTAFYWNGSQFVGNGLIVGSTLSGKAEDAKIGLEEAKKRVQFADRFMPNLNGGSNQYWDATGQDSLD